MKQTLPWLLAGVLVGCGLNGTNGSGGSNGGTGPQGPAGPQGPQGIPGTSGTGTTSISAINPASVLGARPAIVTISGVGTNFKAGMTTVDFADPGITVSAVNVGSVSNLTVSLNVTPQALIGAHNVTVTTPNVGASGTNEQLIVQSGLTVQASLYSELPTGVNTVPNVLQGGLATIQLRNLDYRENPFDPLTVHPAGGVVALMALANPPASLINTTTYGNLTLVDALAPAGTGVAMTVSSLTPLGTPVLYVSDPKDPKAPQVMANVPAVLNAGAPVGNQKIATPSTTVLYKFTTAADNTITQLSLTTLGTGLLPMFAAPPRVIGNLAPTTGRFADGLPIDTALNTSVSMGGRDAMLYMPVKGDYYFALFTDDLSGSANHTYTIGVKNGAGNAFTLKEPVTPDSPAMPVATLMLGQNFYALDGAVDFVGDIDYIKFTTSNATMGRVYITAQTATGAKLAVSIWDSTCNTMQLAVANLTSGAASQEMGVSATTQYCARVTGPGLTPYQLQIAQDLP